MRVISGIYKRRRFEVPKSFKARPTTDFAKENLFNVLMKYIDMEDNVSALDLFAGTGSISLELISRGCDKVVSVEKEPLHFSFIIKVMKELGEERRWFPVRGDVFRFLKGTHEAYDFVFADPPYNLIDLDKIPDLVLDNGVVKEEGLLVLEHGKENDFSQHPCFLERRVYGSVNFSFFAPASKQGREQSDD